MKPKQQNDYINNNYQKPNKLKDCKVENYKIDNDLKALYKITNSGDALQPRIFKTIALDQLETNATDFFFILMKSFQCEDFTMYFENDYNIIKIVSLLSNQSLELTLEQLAFLKRFFSNISAILITLFDKRLKPIINNLTDSTINSSSSISKTLDSTKPRILN